MPTWTLPFITCAGLIALLGRIPLSGSVIEAFLLACCLGAAGLTGMYGMAAVRSAAAWLRDSRATHPPSAGAAFRGAHL